MCRIGEGNRSRDAKTKHFFFCAFCQSAPLCGLMISCGSKEGGDDNSKTVDLMQYAQTYAGAASSEGNGLTNNRPYGSEENQTAAVIM
jgi:hypothetical protein